MSPATEPLFVEIARAARVFVLRRVEADAIQLRIGKPRIRRPLTSLAKDTLRALTFQFANVLTGRCNPSLATIARAAGCSESSVKRHLPALRIAGYLEWRPGKRKRMRTRRGWRIVRAANRYQLTCPGQYLAELHAWLLRRFQGKHRHLIKLVVSRLTPPTAEAMETARIVDALAQDLRPSLNRMTPPPAQPSPIRDTDPPSQGPPGPQGSVEIAGVKVADPELGSVLSRLWAGLEKRESSED